MSKGLVTVFGGSGFLGKHVVRALVKEGWRVRIPMRRPHTGQDLKVIGNVGQVQLIQANIRGIPSVKRAVQGSDAVINLTAILFASGKQTFEAVHQEGASHIAEAAQGQKINNFVHVSSIGADHTAQSEYARSKAAGETAIRTAVPMADIMRPSILFGPEDSFFNRFAAMTAITPGLPLIGGGDTKFQPVYVGDVAKAITKVLNRGTDGTTYELGGPRNYSFKELIQFMLAAIDRKRILLPVPWFAAGAIGFIGEMTGLIPFIDPFITRDQVASLKDDNVVADDAIGFEELGIPLETVEAIVPAYLARYRKYGQFHERQT